MTSLLNPKPRPALYEKARSFLSRTLGRLHRHLFWDRNLLLNENIRHSAYQIGEHTYGHPTGSPRVVHFGEGAKLRIGKFCSFAENVTILLGGNHRTDWVTTYPFSALFESARGISGHPMSKGDINIGHDVWIGSGATILSGVSVGNGAVVGAGAVITKDVPPYCIAAGNPARVVKKRFADDLIEGLNEIAWWDWPIEKIEEEFPLLLSSRIEAFVEKHRCWGASDESGVISGP
jgi:acetyltransferase-like isoleucine patch superfamily enzyme